MEALWDISGLQKDCGMPTRDLGVTNNKKKNENSDSRILVLVQGASVCLTVSYCLFASQKGNNSQKHWQARHS